MHTEICTLVSPVFLSVFLNISELDAESESFVMTQHSGFGEVWECDWRDRGAVAVKFFIALHDSDGAFFRVVCVCVCVCVCVRE